MHEVKRLLDQPIFDHTCVLSSGIIAPRNATRSVVA